MMAKVGGLLLKLFLSSLVLSFIVSLFSTSNRNFTELIIQVFGMPAAMFYFMSAGGSLGLAFFAWSSWLQVRNPLSTIPKAGFVSGLKKLFNSPLFISALGLSVVVLEVFISGISSDRLYTNLGSLFWLAASGLSVLLFGYIPIAYTWVKEIGLASAKASK
jgi:hypothetical protein